MKFFGLLLLSFLSLTAVGQSGFSFEQWHNGKVILEGGDTLKGLVKYTMESDLLQIQHDQRAESLTARKVVFFEIFDALEKTYRQFYSLPYALQGQYRAPTFFELLTEGKMTLLCRENLEYKTTSSLYYYGSYTRLVLVHKYFLLTDKGEIREFQGSKNDWIYEMGNQGSQVQKFAKTNKLDFTDKAELTKIVAYYNSLFEK